MKIEATINKKYAFAIIGSLLLIGGIIFVIAQSPTNPGHPWSGISGKPNFNQCNGNDEALKTINLATGAVTCETDDAGGGGGGVSNCNQVHSQGYNLIESFSVPNECIEKTCTILIVARESAGGNLLNTAIFRYIQNMPAVNSNEWLAEGAIRSPPNTNFASSGTNGGNSEQIVNLPIPQSQPVILYDDKNGEDIPGANTLALETDESEGFVYVCTN